MRRFVIVGSLGLAVVVALAGPAQAKGPGFENQMAVSGSVTIDGPGLAEPIDQNWHGDCLAYCTMGLGKPNAFRQLATGAGLFGFRGSALQDTPPRGHLGPRYQVRFTVTYRNGHSETVTADLYPYGPGDLPPYITQQPWFHFGPGQRFLHTDISAGWWPGPSTLLHGLHDLGVPSKRALAERLSNSGATTAAGFAAGAAFAALLIAGALAGRPRRRRTSSEH